MNRTNNNIHHELHADAERAAAAAAAAADDDDNTGGDEEHDDDDSEQDGDAETGTDVEEEDDDESYDDVYNDEDDGSDTDDDDDDDDDDEQDDSDSDDTVPTPEEVELEYTYPQDFEGSTSWRDVVDAGQYFRLILDPSCTEIAARKFRCCSRLIELVVPKNSVLTNIRYDTFYGCNNLQRITNGLPETLLIMEDYTFAYCSSLHGHLVIPPNVTRLGVSCFRGCSKLTSVVFQPSTTIDIIGTQHTSVELGQSCFEECLVLRSVRLPQTLITIPHFCFFFCKELTDILIPKSVRKLKEASFLDCANLRSIDLPDNIDELCHRSFIDCTSLEQIIIRSSSSQIRFGDNIFLRCSSLSTIKVYPWLFPKIFKAMNGDPSFIYKFFHKYHHQILDERADRDVVTRQHPNGRRRRRRSRGKQKRQRQGSFSM